MKILIIVIIIVISIMILNVIRFKSLTKKWKFHPNRKWYMVNGTNGSLQLGREIYPITSTLIKSKNKVVLSFLVGSIAKKMNQNIDVTMVSLSDDSSINSVVMNVPIINGELVFEDNNYIKFESFIIDNIQLLPNKKFRIEVSSKLESLNITTNFTNKGYPI